MGRAARGQSGMSAIESWTHAWAAGWPVVALAVTTVLLPMSASLQPHPTRRRGRVPRALVLTLSAAVVILFGVRQGWRWGLLVVTAAVIVVVVRRLVARAHARRTRRRREAAVIDLCDALASELAAGLAARRALILACGTEAEWSRVVATARLQGDVSAALLAEAQAPGARGLRAVAAAWDVSARSGAGLAAVVEHVADSLRDEREAQAEVSASLAPARATGKLLAVLPLFGLALGASMGADPLGFLTGTGVGIGCLLGGVLLSLCGLLWVERLADAAEA